MVPRIVLAAIGLAVSLGAAQARGVTQATVTPIPGVTLYYLDGHISDGQSWESNSFDTLASPYNFNPLSNVVLAPLWRNSVNRLSGPLPQAAGISIPGPIVGITGNTAATPFTIGLTAMLAQQQYRILQGIALSPLLQFNVAYPSSTWKTGPAGGLGPGAAFTGSVTSNLISVDSGLTGYVAEGQTLFGAGIPDDFTVFLDNSGSGGVGTYYGGVWQNVPSTTMTVGSASVVASVGGTSPSLIMEVTEVDSGPILEGDTVQSVPSGSVGANTTILPFGTYSTTGTGGIGTYAYQTGSPTTVGSEAMTSVGRSWTNLQIILNSMSSGALPSGSAEGVRYSSLDYTQGQALGGTILAKEIDLASMIDDFDADSRTSGMKYYLQLPPAQSQATTFPNSYFGTYTFARTNAPGQGGFYSGRVFATTPMYAWPFDVDTNIHTGDYGTARTGEFLGYVRGQVQDHGVAWTPLWRSLSAAITVSGQLITIPFSRPGGADFAAAVMAWQSSASDGIKVWPQYGFDLLDNGVECAATPVISGTSVQLTATGCTIHSGDSLEVSYAWYGPGGPNPGPNSGVGGNLAMAGPASSMFPGNSLLAWAWPFDETIVAP